MQQAAELSVAAPTIEAALDGRFMSGLKDQRVAAAKFFGSLGATAPTQQPVRSVQCTACRYSQQLRWTVLLHEELCSCLDGIVSHCLQTLSDAAMDCAAAWEPSPWSSSLLLLAGPGLADFFQLALGGLSNTMQSAELL